jgi:hypothetical protein
MQEALILPSGVTGAGKRTQVTAEIMKRLEEYGGKWVVVPDMEERPLVFDQAPPFSCETMRHG